MIINLSFTFKESVVLISPLDDKSPVVLSIAKLSPTVTSALTSKLDALTSIPKEEVRIGVDTEFEAVRFCIVPLPVTANPLRFALVPSKVVAVTFPVSISLTIKF